MPPVLLIPSQRGPGRESHTRTQARGNHSREERRFPWKIRGGAGTFVGVNVSASGYEIPPKNEPDPGA